MYLVRPDCSVDTRNMKRTSFIFGILLLCLALPVIAAEKVTICHASGQDDTTHFVTLEISENAVYGNGGHFEENGTPQSGHERDHFGPCAADPDVTTTTGEGTTTTQGGTTTTTGQGTTTTTQAGTTTTTGQGTTTTTQGGTTTTTQGGTTTTTQGGTTNQGGTTGTTQAETAVTTDSVVEEASVVAGLTVTQADQAVAATNQAAVPASVDASTMTELPFTGVNSGVLALIAIVLTLAGTFLLKSASIGVSPSAGA